MKKIIKKPVEEKKEYVPGNKFKFLKYSVWRPKKKK